MFSCLAHHPALARGPRQLIFTFSKVKTHTVDLLSVDGNIKCNFSAAGGKGKYSVFLVFGLSLSALTPFENSRIHTKKSKKRFHGHFVRVRGEGSIVILLKDCRQIRIKAL